MENSYTKLPENYDVVREVDLQKNRKVFWFINIGSIVFLIPFIVIYFFLDRSIGMKDGVKFILVLLLLLIVIFLILPMQVIIQSIFLKIYGKGKLKFGLHETMLSVSMPTHLFSKKAYIIISLAPFIIITIITLVLSILLYNKDFFLLAYVPLALNLPVSMGCIYIVGVLLKYNKTVLVHDKGVSMKFYDLVK